MKNILLLGSVLVAVSQKKQGNRNINQELENAFHQAYLPKTVATTDIRIGSGSFNTPSINALFLSADPSMVNDNLLVAILLYGVTGPKNPMTMATEILGTVDGQLGQLISGSFLGSTYSTASKAKMIAAAELTRRANYRSFLSGKSDVSITTPDAMFRAFKEANMSVGHSEVMSALFFNNARNVIGSMIISKGSHRMTLADPSYIIGEALKKNATGVSLCHQHPSGNATFSDQDIKVGQAITAAAKCVGITMLDFLAIAGDDYSSAVSWGIL